MFQTIEPTFCFGSMYDECFYMEFISLYLSNFHLPAFFYVLRL